jgi:hypothetical protein
MVLLRSSGLRQVLAGEYQTVGGTQWPQLQNRTKLHTIISKHFRLSLVPGTYVAFI